MTYFNNICRKSMKAFEFYENKKLKLLIIFLFFF